MLIPQAYAQAAGQTPQGGGMFLPLMMVGILLFMYFTTISSYYYKCNGFG